MDIIVPNMLEAEAMLLMMNCHFPASCFHYLTGEGVDSNFVKELLCEACCPMLVGHTWELDGERSVKTLHTRNDPEEAAVKKRKG